MFRTLSAINGSGDDVNVSPRSGPETQRPAWWYAPAPIGEILVVLIALLLRIVMFTGPSVADDFAHLEHARDWADGVYDASRETYVYATRYGVVLPAAAAMRFLGVSPWAVSLPALLASLLGVCCVMVIGTRLGGRPVGLLAGLAVALNPHSVMYGTKVLPEAFFDLPLWAALALCVIGNERRSRGWLFVAGLVGGYSYLVRSFGLALVLVGAFPVLGWRRSIGRWWPLIAGLAILPVAEAIYHGLMTGNPLLTMMLNHQVFSNLPELNDSLMFYPRELWGGESDFLRFPWLVFFALPFAWRAGPVGRFGIVLLALWGGFFEFGVMSLKPFVLFHKVTRHLSVLVLPMALVLAAALQRIWVTWPSWARVVPAAVVAIVVLLDLGEVKQRAGWQDGGMEKYRVVASAIIANRPAGVAFPHFRWPLRLNYFAGYVDGYRAIAPPRPGARFRVPDARAEPLPGEWVIVDPGMFGPSGEWQLWRAPLPAWMENPPADWPERMRTGDVRVVEVSSPTVAPE